VFPFHAVFSVVKLGDNCIVFENFTTSIGDLMVVNWAYWRREIFKYNTVVGSKRVCLEFRKIYQSKETCMSGRFNELTQEIRVCLSSRKRTSSSSSLRNVTCSINQAIYWLISSHGLFTTVKLLILRREGIGYHSNEYVE
jgi:hypothetical protein